MASITQKGIERMKPGEFLWDDRVKGFGVRYRGGSYQFLLKNRIAGRVRWFTIGTFGSPFTVETARNAALELLGDIAKGEDPSSVREATRDLKTFSDVARLYLIEHCGVKREALEFLPKELAEKHRGRRTRARPKVKFAAEPRAKVKASTARTYRDALLDHVIPHIGKRRIDSITSGDLDKLHRDLKGTPRLANFCLSVVSTLQTWATTNGHWPKMASVVGGIERYAEVRREKFLNADETRRAVKALADAEAEGLFSVHAAHAIRFLLLTGLRPKEALALRWSDLDFDEGTVRLPDTKTGPRTATVSTHALEVLTTVPRMEGNPFVFCGAKTGTHLTTLQQPFEIIRRKAGFASGTRDGVVLYTLRHNFGSTLAASKVEAYELMRMMGHKNLSTSLRYIHLANAGVQATASKATAALADALKAAEKPKV